MSGAVLVYLILVPVSTWWLGNLLGLLDGAEPAAALRRLVWRSLPYLLAALLLGGGALLPVLAALATALLLHVAWCWVLQATLRHGWLLGEHQD